MITRTRVSLVVTPLALYLINRLAKSVKRASRRALDEMSHLYERLSESLAGIELVKAYTMERHERRVGTREHATNHKTAQETQLFREFSRLALGGSLDPHWPEIALKTQRVLDACLASARDGGREVNP